MGGVATTVDRDDDGRRGVLVTWPVLGAGAGTLRRADADVVLVEIAAHARSSLALVGRVRPGAVFDGELAGSLTRRASRSTGRRTRASSSPSFRCRRSRCQAP